MTYPWMPSDREFADFIARYQVKSRQVAILAERRTPPRLTLDQQQLLHFYQEHERRAASAAEARTDLDPSLVEPSTRHDLAAEVTERMLAAGERIFTDMNRRQSATTERTAA